ncbi:MAG: hypothetical protein JRH01_04815 [Deltaproteobacteria bacterium]|nr:hypothetical protein [Deltaproteobacteria bacterium]
MAGLGLLLGGGGSVGIAWENGVLAGLVDAMGFEPAQSTVIVGTSAGSSVGADMALGKDPHDALALDRDASNPRRKLSTPDLEKGAFAEIIKFGNCVRLRAQTSPRKNKAPTRGPGLLNPGARGRI